MAKRWFYSGDADIENGGFFYDLSNFDDLGYAQAVRVTPCSDAGGPDNVFWVEMLSVNTGDKDAIRLAYSGVGDDVQTRRAHRTLHHDPNLGSLNKLIERIEQALDCCGWDRQLKEWDALTWAQKRHVVVDACVSYGHYDQESSEMVSLGKPEFTRNREGEWKPDKVLRASASLRNYAKGKCS